MKFGRRLVKVAPVKGSLTADRNDAALSHGVDETPVGMADKYLVLSEDERAMGFVRPVRRTYFHVGCGGITTMGTALAETYARDPNFYGATYCASCCMHRPVGADGEFVWVVDNMPTDIKVGT